MDLLGFWSYVHADDEVDMGRVTQLAKDIVGHYEAIRAESIRLFLDRDDLHWGDQWREEVDEALSNVAFFIPVITPRYFTRVECRRELQFFVTKAERLNITELILPILYIDVPELHEDEPSDPLMRVIKQIQWEPWTAHRFRDRDSAEYRSGVDALATELVRRVRAVERTDVASAAVASEELLRSDDGEAGTLDRIAALEEAMPRWTETLESIGAEINRIGELMQSATADMEAGEKQGKGFAARLTVARRVAGELAGPVAQIESLGQAFANDLADIDAGVQVLLAEAAEQAVEDPSQLPDLCEFMATLKALAESSREGLGSVAGMIEGSQAIERMSKDMRAPLRRLRSSLTAMLQAREITDSWENLVNAMPVDCSGAASTT
jgi:hypothetical protein